MKYFYNKTIVDIADGASIVLGNSVEESNVFVPFNAEQLRFIELNPLASYIEVQNLKMDYGVINPDTKTLKLLASNPFLESKSVAEIKATDVDMLENLHNYKRYSRGYKIYSRWFNEADFQDRVTTPVVERLYSLVFEEGVLKGEKIVMNWYNENGSLAFSKENIESYSAKDSAKILEGIRKTRILYLQNPESEYVNATMKQYIAMLFAHYKNEVLDYTLSGSDSFEKAILNETNTQINQILSAILPDKKTVKESILYQIQGGY